MSPNAVEDFAKYLASKSLIAGLVISKFDLPSGAQAIRRLWELTDLSANDFADEVARFYGARRMSLAELMEARPLVGRFSRRFLLEMSVFPFEAADGSYGLAVGDPVDSAPVRAAEIVLGGPVSAVIASFEDIATVLTARLGEEDLAPADAAETGLAHTDDDIENLRDLASGAPIVRAVNDLLERAMELRASDIHIEPFRQGLTVRMRVDGLLRAVAPPAGALPQALISRIKILSGLNIAERRLPQDGAARMRLARSEIDIRVATMPTQHGEAAVIRLLPRDRGLLDLGKLGLAGNDEQRMRRLLGLPHGMIVITGPTGSGKTTTLATMLSILNEPTRKILTIEDPVEYELQGVNQSQVKPAIGLTFASALRAFVRQDPDVIMVGEVRDAETANIAIHAALTGHLVLTTLHTETAAAALPRLLDLGVEGFLLKSTLRATIAQRLVRTLCDRCKTRKKLDLESINADPRFTALGFRPDDTVFEPHGCDRCGGTGYRGRSGIFEIIEMTGAIRNLITGHTDSEVIHTASVKAGMTTMIDDAIAKCRAGVTSAAEVLRVTTVGG
ncbi:MAG TPA: GspE/PulE family protein [Pseudolabrys sp.]|nr:GspE/PulE family protein [Pseudolabrys sp.]